MIHTIYKCRPQDGPRECAEEMKGLAAAIRMHGDVIWLEQPLEAPYTVERIILRTAEDVLAIPWLDDKSIVDLIHTLDRIRHRQADEAAKREATPLSTGPT